MKQIAANGWFPSQEFERAAKAIHNAATKLHTHWLNVPGAKYVEIRVDQRTGDFLLKDQDGRPLTLEEIYTLFPELQD